MRWSCSKHDIEWEVSKTDQKYPAECPWCLSEENAILRQDRIKILEQRNALAKAIDVAVLIKTLE